MWRWCRRQWQQRIWRKPSTTKTSSVECRVSRHNKTHVIGIYTRSMVLMVHFCSSVDGMDTDRDTRTYRTMDYIVCIERRIKTRVDLNWDNGNNYGGTDWRPKCCAKNGVKSFTKLIIMIKIVMQTSVLYFSIFFLAVAVIITSIRLSLKGRSDMSIRRNVCVLRVAHTIC